MEERQVLDLLLEWEDAVKWSSSIDHKLRHPIAMRLLQEGVTILPAVLYYLDSCQLSPERGTAALSAFLVKLVGVKPFRPESRHYVRKLEEDWLRWGKKHGLWNP